MAAESKDLFAFRRGFTDLLPNRSLDYARDDSLVRNLKQLAKLQFPHKKTAPGVPGAMLKEPKLFCRKTGGLCAEGQCFRFAAVCFYPQLMGVVQADKTHITGGVYDLMVVFQINREGLPGRKLNEVLDLLKRAEPDTEFLHKNTPSASVQMEKSCV